MKSWPMAAFVFASFLADSLAGESSNTAGWLDNYRAAKAAARQSGKPILVVFR